jgi:hypothetical protein
VLGTIIGEKNRFEEDEIQCILYKQCDIFLLGSRFCRSDSKSSTWMKIRDGEGSQIGGRIEYRRVTKLT